MARVTAAEVKEVIPTALGDQDVIQFIAAANSLVTDELGSSDLTETRLKLIEQWLAAHFVAIKDQAAGGNLVEIETGETRARYSSSNTSGDGLNGTKYGQQALLLDTTGTLASRGRTRARFTVLDPIN